MTVSKIVEWHRRARPHPDNRAFDVQLGCHFEEIAEMVKTLVFDSGSTGVPAEDTVLYAELKSISNMLKRGEISAKLTNRRDFLDSVADQVVTVLGTAHCGGMDAVEAVHRVDESNWSKFVGGRPVFDQNGKIAKPNTYHPPNLDGCF